MNLIRTMLALTACSLLGITDVRSGEQESSQISATKSEKIKPFTGKILANKVRIRSKPDMESHIIRLMNKNDLLLVVGEHGNFWAIQPPQGTKAYVFRSYIIDNVVEANRVNVRLEPHVEAPIIAQLQSGDRVEGSVCTMNHKWLEITTPTNARFYVSKEFIEQAGGPDYLAAMDKRKQEAAQLTNAALFLAEAECKKPFEEMSIQEPMEQIQNILKSYSDFPEYTQSAKEGLALLKDTYLQKKIAYLEARAELTPAEKEALIARHNSENHDLLLPEVSEISRKSIAQIASTDQMRFWNTIEESLYLSWAAFHTEKKVDDFYQEQKANATVLTGTVKPDDHPVKNKPGNFVLQGKNAPVAYLYSTQVNLEECVGKEVTLLASPRPNNHFAFPAYFVISVE